VTVAGGAKVLWDGRFAIEIADGLPGDLEVRALGRAGLAELKRLGCAVKGASGLLLQSDSLARRAFRDFPMRSRACLRCADRRDFPSMDASNGETPCAGNTVDSP